MATTPPTTAPAAPPGGGAGVPTYGATAPSGTSTVTVPTTAPALPTDIASRTYSVASQGTQGSALFSDVQQQIALLDALEHGQPVNNVDQNIIVRVFSLAGIKAGQALTPKRMDALKAETTKLITKNLQTLGVADDQPGGPAKTAEQFRQIVVPDAIKSKFQAQGYNTDNVNTVGTLTDNLSKQQPTKTSNGQLTGADIYNQFNSQIATAGGAAAMATLLNAAGVTDGTLTGAEGPALQTAFQKVLSQTPAGTDPFTYLQSQATTIKGAGIDPTHKPDSPFAYVNGLANTIWGTGVVSENEVNAIAAEYPDAGSSSADDTAIKQAVAQAGASTWQYDPNEQIAGGSYLKSVVNAIQDTAGQYGLPLDSQTITNLAKDTLKSGDLTSIYGAIDSANATTEQHAKDISSNMYPALSPMIKQGYSLQDIVAPYKQMAAQTLGVSADSINLTGAIDPQTGKVDPANSNAAWGSLLESPEGKMPSVNQFQATVMQDPRFNWQNSADAETKYANMAQTLVSTWGKTGGGPQAYTAPSNGLAQ